MIQHACLHHSSANMRIRPAVHACITPCQTTEATNRYQAICNTWFYGSPRFGETIKLTPAEANLLIWQKIKWGSWKQNPFFFLMKGSSFKTRWWGPAKSLLPEEKKKKKKRRKKKKPELQEKVHYQTGICQSHCCRSWS